ncbi:MAG: PAS domain S-box protein [Acidobacteriota bacterium]
MILYWLGATAILALAFVWLGVRLFFRPAILALKSAARRWSEGDFSARVGLKRGPNEMIRLARLLDQMAVRLQEQMAERKQIEDELRKRQRQLEQAQARARLGFWEINPRTRAGFWSEEMYALLDRDPSLGPTTFEEFQDMTHPQDRQMLTDAYLRALKSKEPIHIDFRINTARDTRYFSATVEAVRDAEEQVMMIAGTIIDITSRKLAEERLRESERRFRDMLENVQLIALLLDREGRVTFCNDYLLNLTGYSREEMLGCDWFEVFIPDDEKRVKEEFIRGIRAGEIAAHYENSILTRSGELRFITWNNTILRGPGGRVIGTTSIGEDITSRKEAEEALRETTRKLNSTINNLSGFVYRCANEPDYPMEYVSEGVFDLLGYRAEDFISGKQTVSLLIAPDDRDRVWAEIQSAIETRSPYVLEYRMSVASGEEKWVWEKGSGVFDGERLVALEGFVTDITARKRAEAERDRLFNLSIDLLCVAGFDGFFKQLNPSWHKTLGWNEGELLGKPFLEFVHPDDREETVKTMQTLTENKPALAFENRYRCRDGSYRWISWNSFPLADENLIFAVARDITAHKQAEEALRESEAKLRKVIDGLGPYMFVGLMTTEGVLIEANQPALAAAGLKREDVLGKPFDQTYWWSYSESVQQQLRETIRSAAAGTPSRYDVQVRVGEGVFIWIDFSINPLRDEAGEVVFLVPSANVITERKQAEEERQIILLNEQKARAEAEAMRDANIVLTQSLSLDDTLETLLDCLGRIVPYDSANVMLREGSRFAVRAIRGYETLTDARATREISFGANENRLIGNMIAVQHSIIVDDTGKNSDWETRQGTEHVRNWMGVPLMVGGQMIGLYSLDKTEPNFFTYEHARLAESLAAQAAVAIQNALLYEEVERYTSELEQRIEERDRAKEQLAASERLYRSLFERNLSGVSRVTLDGKLLECNQAFASIFGYDSPEEALSRAAMDFQRDPAASEELIAQLLESRALTNIEKMIRCKDGSTLWVLGNVSLIEDPSGEKVVLETFIDITSRKRAEAALRESETRLQLFIRHAPAALAMFDRDMRYLAVSRRWMADYGLGDEEITGRSHYDIFPEIPERWKEVHRRGMAGEIVRADEDRFDRTDGSSQWLRWEVRPWHTDSGEVGGIVIFTEDISSRKQAEEALRHQARQLASLHEIGLEISAESDLHHLFDIITRRAADLTGAHWSSIWTYHPETSDLALVAALNEKFIGQRMSIGRGLAGRAVSSGQSCAIESYSQWEGKSNRLDEYNYGPGIAIPLKHQQEILGVISLARLAGAEPFTEQDTRFLEQLAAQAAIAIHQARLFEEVRASRERLQMLSQRLIDAQEKERRALARELHDEIGQVLTAVKINLQTLQRLHASSTLVAHLDESVGIVSRALDQVRNMSLDLRPSMLDDFGLAPALRWYIKREAQRAGIEAQLKIDPPDLRTTAEIETVCFRVAQEAMTNITRHAQARRVKIELKRCDSQLQLSIEDDGRGFDVETVRKRASEGASLGILGIEERVFLAGGRVEITSSSEGSRVCAVFPAHTG